MSLLGTPVFIKQRPIVGGQALKYRFSPGHYPMALPQGPAQPHNHGPPNQAPHYPNRCTARSISASLAVKAIRTCCFPRGP